MIELKKNNYPQIQNKLDYNKKNTAMVILKTLNTSKYQLLLPPKVKIKKENDYYLALVKELDFFVYGSSLAKIREALRFFIISSYQGYVESSDLSEKGVDYGNKLKNYIKKIS